jgi:hypothetical protein
MSNGVNLFDQYWFYPSPVSKAAGTGSDKGAGAGGAESSAADLFSGYWGPPTAQAGASMGGGSGSLLTTPRLIGYHLKVEPLSPGKPFPQATVEGRGQFINGIYFYRKYTLLDQNNKPVPNAFGTESAVKLRDSNNLVSEIGITDWLTDANGSFADDPLIKAPSLRESLPESFEVIIDQKLWYRDKLIAEDTQRFVRHKGDDVNGVANHSSLTYHEGIPVTILE